MIQKKLLPDDVQEYHVVPIEDIMEHDDSTECWCDPYWDQENYADYMEGKANKIVIAHRKVKEILQ